MQIELLTPPDPRWVEVLASIPHDFYHHPAYLELCAHGPDEKARAALVTDAGGTFFLPLVVRPLPSEVDGWDATTPYGYPGPLVQTAAEDREAFVSAAVGALCRALGEQGCVSLFARLHPLLNEDLAGLEPHGRVVMHGETVIVDLSRTQDDLWRETQSGHRSEINQSLRAGHRAFFDTEWKHFDDFVRIYSQTMRRVGANDFYFFTEDYFRALREALGPQHLHLGIVEIDGHVAAAALFTEFCGTVQYHLSGTDEAFLKKRPTKLLLHHARAWAQGRGNRWLHLGGGLGAAADSLFRFKAGFSSSRRIFRSWRAVTRQDAYRAITRKFVPEIDPDDLHGFFPAYRRPPAAPLARVSAAASSDS